VKVLLSATLAAAALAAALPAMAQDVYDRTANIEQRIDDGVQSGRLTYADADSLRAQLRAIRRDEDRYQDDGMYSWERRDLDRRLDVLSDRVANMNDDDAY
jgi:hypothetical protein